MGLKPVWPAAADVSVAHLHFTVVVEVTTPASPSEESETRIMYVCMVTQRARLWISRVRLPV